MIGLLATARKATHSPSIRRDQDQTVVPGARGFSLYHRPGRTTRHKLDSGSIAVFCFLISLPVLLGGHLSVEGWLGRLRRATVSIGHQIRPHSLQRIAFGGFIGASFCVSHSWQVTVTNSAGLMSLTSSRPLPRPRWALSKSRPRLSASRYERTACLLSPT